VGVLLIVHIRNVSDVSNDVLDVGIGLRNGLFVRANLRVDANDLLFNDLLLLVSDGGRSRLLDQ
jgi:hypothetical protein